MCMDGCIYTYIYRENDRMTHIYICVCVCVLNCVHIYLHHPLVCHSHPPPFPSHTSPSSSPTAFVGAGPARHGAVHRHEPDGRGERGPVRGAQATGRYYIDDMYMAMVMAMVMAICFPLSHVHSHIHTHIYPPPPHTQDAQPLEQGVDSDDEDAGPGVEWMPAARDG
jgi:hypothetical protein